MDSEREAFGEWFAEVFQGRPVNFATWTFREPKPDQTAFGRNSWRANYSRVGSSRAVKSADRVASALTIDRASTGAVVAVEGSRDTRFHLHSMSSGTSAAFESTRREWILRNGFVLWSPINDSPAAERVALYVAKYCSKDRGKHFAFGGDLWLQSART